MQEESIRACSTYVSTSYHKHLYVYKSHTHDINECFLKPLSLRATKFALQLHIEKPILKKKGPIYLAPGFI